MSLHFLLNMAVIKYQVIKERESMVLNIPNLQNSKNKKFLKFLTTISFFLIFLESFLVMIIKYSNIEMLKVIGLIIKINR